MDIMIWKYFLYGLEKRFKDMEIREWIGEHPKQIIYIAAGSVLLLLVIIAASLWPSNQPEKPKVKYVWFYDLNTNKLFKADEDMRPPVKAPSGPLPDGSPAGVRAYVFTTAKEPNELDLIIVYLEKFASQAEEFSKEQNPNAGNPDEIIRAWAKNRLIKQPQDVNWFAADSRGAMDIIQLKYVPEDMRYNLRPYTAE
jgi:hypothetical protein